MAFDYALLLFSLATLIFYIATVIFLFRIKSHVIGDLSFSFWLLIFSITLLIIRRIYYLFDSADIIIGIPYFRDIFSLLFAITFFLATCSFYRSLKSLGKNPQRRRKPKNSFQSKYEKVPRSFSARKMPRRNDGGYLDLTR